MYHAEMEQAITCGNCGAAIDEALDLPEGRCPCPECGSTSRVFHKAIRATARGVPGYRRHMRRRGSGRHRHGYDYEDDERTILFHGKAPAILRMIVDRVNDVYHKLIRDRRTGEALYEDRGPLSEHRDRGDAKRRPR